MGRKVVARSEGLDVQTSGECLLLPRLGCFSQRERNHLKRKGLSVAFVQKCAQEVEKKGSQGEGQSG
jgi:hypothetical protein